MRDVDANVSPAVPVPPDKRTGLEVESNNTQTSNDTIAILANLNPASLEPKKVICMRTRQFKINPVPGRTKTVTLMLQVQLDYNKKLKKTRYPAHPQ